MAEFFIAMAKKAQPKPSLPASVRKVLEGEGVWLCYDLGRPGAVVPLVSERGRIFSMCRDSALDPARFLDGARFAGPFWAGEGAEPVMLTSWQRKALLDLLANYALMADTLGGRVEWLDFSVDPPVRTRVEDLARLLRKMEQ